ncbi:unnamed protein product [Closterium sp. NIES-53]
MHLTTDLFETRLSKIENRLRTIASTTGVVVPPSLRGALHLSSLSHRGGCGRGGGGGASTSRVADTGSAGSGGAEARSASFGDATAGGAGIGGATVIPQ